MDGGDVVVFYVVYVFDYIYVVYVTAVVVVGGGGGDVVVDVVDVLVVCGNDVVVCGFAFDVNVVDVDVVVIGSHQSIAVGKQSAYKLWFLLS